MSTTTPELTLLLAVARYVREIMMQDARRPLADVIAEISAALEPFETVDEATDREVVEVFEAPAVLVEREACAQIAHATGWYSERYVDDPPRDVHRHNAVCWEIRDRIRGRSKP